MFFTADTHFRHKFMADLRGFGRENLDQHDNEIIERWNAVIGPKDEVYHLGDFSFATHDLNPKLFSRLHGRKHLVRGNHDPANVCNLPWRSVSDIARISIDGQRIVLCHYPMLTWQNAHHGTWHLHGHSHGNGRWTDSTRVDVGIDTNDMKPYSYEEVSKIMATRTYDFIDHHE